MHLSTVQFNLKFESMHEEHMHAHPMYVNDLTLFAEFPHVSKQVCFYYLIISLNLKLKLPSGQEFIRWKSNVDLVVC